MSHFCRDKAADDVGIKPGNALQAAILNAWDGLIYVCGPDHLIRFMNSRFIDTLGRDATGEPCYHALHNREEPCPWCPEEVFSGELVSGTFQQPADGRWHQVLNLPLTLPDGTGAKVAFIRETPEPETPVRDLPVFRNIVDHLSDAVFFHNPLDGRLTYINNSGCSLLGCSQSMLLGSQLSDHAEIPAPHRNWPDLLACLEKERTAVFEARLLHRKGPCIDVEVKATRLRAGLHNLIVTVARDITERKRTEARLIEERNKFEAIMAATGDGITVQDRNLRIIYQNEVLIRRRGNRLGEPCYGVYAHRDRVCDDCQALKSFADGRVHRRPFTTTTPDGEPLHLEISACPLRDAAGEVVACVEVVRDVTEQKWVEQELQESNEKYRRLFSAESDAILTYDATTGRIREVNDAACRLYGLEREELVGCNWSDLRVGGGEEIPGQILVAEHFRGDGSLFPAEFSTGEFHWRGRPMKVAVVRDLTERKRLEKSREEAFSAVSHEMRTPLTAVLGFAQFLQENAVPPDQQREYLDLIVKEGNRLKRLIDNLLSLQRLRAGFGLENPAPVLLYPLLCEVAEAFRTPLVRQLIEIDGAPGIPPVSGEALSLQEAVTNLLDNAIKYSPADSTIVVGVRTEGDSVLLWVQDQGPGIPVDKQEKIFERFYRLEAHRKPVGTGLGLALVWEIAQAHGGRVWVESTPGRGSTFFLRLPLDRP